jgi:hypothetical protein
MLKKVLLLSLIVNATTRAGLTPLNPLPGKSLFLPAIEKL